MPCLLAYWWLALGAHASEDEVAARDERSKLGPSRGTGRLAEPAVGDEADALGRDAGAQHLVDPLGDVVRTLEIRVLDVDHAGRDVTTGRDDLGEDLDLGHLAIG